MTEAEAKFNGGYHNFPVRVYFEDTDAGGIVYYANYLHFAERARSEMLRHLGIESGRMVKESGLVFAVKSCSIDFIKSARLDDLLLVKTRLIEIGGASLKVSQKISMDGLDLVFMKLKLACISLEGRPVRMPSKICSQLDQLKKLTEVE
jgi:acyl-CoA thioester hydrolase